MLREGSNLVRRFALIVAVIASLVMSSAPAAAVTDGFYYALLHKA